MTESEIEKLRIDNMVNLSRLNNTLHCLMQLVSFTNKDLKDKEKIKENLYKTSGIILKTNNDLLECLDIINEEINKILES